MKKIIVLALVALLCLALVSCGDGAPEGMQSATAEGEPFALYVPKTWTKNTTSGTSSAYVKISDQQVIVSARHFAMGEVSLSDFVSLYIPSIEEGLGESFSLVANTKTVLAGKDAEKLLYTFDASGTSFTATQYFIEYGGDAITLCFYSTKDASETFAENITAIVDNFTLAEKSEIKEDAIVDKNTPDGMKIASSDILEYRFYVPKTWVCAAENGISEAYFPESDKTNVTVTSYSPDAEMTLKEYFELCEKNYAESINGYTHLSTLEGARVAGLEAYDFIFSATYGERNYRVRQVVFYSPVSGLFYNVTYTATAENYKLHIADFEEMLDAFTLR